MAKRKVDREIVAGLVRGLAVLKSFDQAHSEMTLSEVARCAGLTPATARRSLHTLASLGYVRSVNRRFLLGPQVLEIGSAYLNAARVDEVLLPELRRIVHMFGDAASVSLLCGTDILYIAHYSEQRAVRATARAGNLVPAFATSAGRVLLAELTSEEIEKYFETARFDRFTRVTEVDQQRLRRIIEAARKSGFATVVDQLTYGVTALAVPIRSPKNKAVAALNTSGYTGNVTPKDLIDRRLKDLRRSAVRISDLLNKYPALLHSLESHSGL